MTVVMKFGGTSVQDAAAIRRLIGHVAAEPRHRAVVVSALAGVTDALLAVAAPGGSADRAGAITGMCERHLAVVRALVPAGPERDELVHWLQSLFEDVASERSRDALLAIGELASSRIVAAALAAAGVRAAWVDARDVIVTDARAGQARPDAVATRAAAARVIAPVLASHTVPVMGGFVGATRARVTTTLGRGGGDYSAALLGAAIDAAEVQIWTDVDGVFSADPRKVPAAMLIPVLSFREAYELARFGAKVLHWGTLEPAASHDIPVRVLNATRGGAQPGTTIAAGPRRSRPTAIGVAQQDNVTVVSLRPRGVSGCLDFLQAAAGWLERHAHGLTVVSLSPARLVASGPEASATALATALTALASAEISPERTLVTLVGSGIAAHPDAWEAVHEAIAAGHARWALAAQSGDALACVTDPAQAARLFAELHARLPPRAADNFDGSKEQDPPYALSAQ